MIRSRRKINYHGRTGYPVIHKTEKGKKYMMVRSNNGTKRLYEGSKYKTNDKTKKLKL